MIRVFLCQILLCWVLSTIFSIYHPKYRGHYQTWESSQLGAPNTSLGNQKSILKVVYLFIYRRDASRRNLNHCACIIIWNGLGETINKQTSCFQAAGWGMESLGLALPSIGTPTVTQLVFFGDYHALCNQKLLTLKSGKLVTSIQWRWGSERWNTESGCFTKWRHTDSRASCLFWVETSFV